MSEKEKATRDYLETLSKDQVINLCLQFMFDVEVSERQIDQLKQQLAEKDKEVEKLTEKNNEVVKNFYDLVKQTEDFNHEQYKEQMSLIDEIEEFKQNQTQLAIQELEKVNGILTDTIIEVT